MGRITKIWLSSPDLHQQIVYNPKLSLRWIQSTSQTNWRPLTLGRSQPTERLPCQLTACCKACSPPTPAGPAVPLKGRRARFNPWRVACQPLLWGQPVAKNHCFVCCATNTGRIRAAQPHLRPQRIAHGQTQLLLCQTSARPGQRAEKREKTATQENHRRRRGRGLVEPGSGRRRNRGAGSNAERLIAPSSAPTDSGRTQNPRSTPNCRSRACPRRGPQDRQKLREQALFPQIP